MTLEQLNILLKSTSEVSLRTGTVTVQPFEKWIHDLCTAKTLETRAYILMEPFQSPNLKDSIRAKTKTRRTKLLFSQIQLRTQLFYKAVVIYELVCVIRTDMYDLKKLNKIKNKPKHNHQEECTKPYKFSQISQQFTKTYSIIITHCHVNNYHFIGWICYQLLFKFKWFNYYLLFLLLPHQI